MSERQQRALEHPAYTVEVEKDGCPHCGAGRLWTVVGPDDFAEGVGFSNQEDAEDLAEAMNRAYAAGIGTGPKSASPDTETR